jgi:hypothetical protein
MIAKGLHFPNVTLVGIVHADLSLHLPDFRAGERTFQLLTQVSGRAGRGDVEGEVFVQTFTPFHPAIQYARRHDFLGFYEQEIEFREQLLYPPFARIALLTLKGRNEDKVRFTAEHLRKEMDRWFASWRELIIAGPAPAVVYSPGCYQGGVGYYGGAGYGGYGGWGGGSFGWNNGNTTVNYNRTTSINSSINNSGNTTYYGGARTYTGGGSYNNAYRGGGGYYGGNRGGVNFTGGRR